MSQLKRDLGLGGAVATGLGSILGTGVFVSIAVAAGFAGKWILLAIPLAGLVATFNGLSSAQLAAAHPVAGGTYEYGYRFLTPWLGFTSGWLFLVAKTASASTAALGFAGYALVTIGADPGLRVPVAVGSAVLVTVLVVAGIRRTAIVNAVLVTLTIAALMWFIVLGFTGVGGGDPLPPDPDVDLGNVLTAIAFMFVAYTGYGRIATLGEEVKNPKRTIPRAVIAGLAVSAALYFLVAAAGLRQVGPTLLAGFVDGSGAPLADATSRAKWVVEVGAILAMLGVLLNLVLGLSRVWLAMGRRADMPGILARVNPKGSPTPAVVLTGLTVAGVALIGDVRTTWTFSAFAVLLYYSITNLAALRLPAELRRFPRWMAWAGLISCLFLSFWVDIVIWLAGAGIVLAGLGWRAARLALRPPKVESPTEEPTAR